MSGEFLTMRETCDVLSLHPRTVRGWLHCGKIAALREGGRGDKGRLYFKRDDVEAIIVERGSLVPAR